jgi:hypothetical protein
VTDLLPIIRADVLPGTRVMTDEAGEYAHLGIFFAEHDFVGRGAGEYVRGDRHTNTVEGFDRVFKRGLQSVYWHRAEKHLDCYVAEFDFCYNNRTKLGVNDAGRAATSLKCIVGKRLTYCGSPSKAL